MAIVTGGSWGIGRAIARRLADEGSSVVIADVEDEDGEELASALERAAFVHADVGRDDEVRRMIAEAEEHFGGLDILVNNACETHPPPFYPEAAPDEWGRVLDVCLRGVMVGVQEALEPMRRRGGGAILNVSSIAGLGPLPHSFVEYAVAKAALVRLTECLAPVAGEGIRVTCLAPDWTATEFVRERMAGMTPEERAEARDGFGRRAPARLLEPDDVADAALRLLSDESLAGVTMALEATDPPRLVPAEAWSGANGRG